MRPVTYMAVGAGVGFLAASSYYRHSDIRDCEEGRFQYGRNCRKCSDWMCPTGQYRTMCTQHADSYCKLCTNKPEGNFVYISPGNDNDCEYEACSTDPNAGLELCMSATEGGVVGGESDVEFTSDSPTELVFYAEMPLDEATFNSVGATYKAALKELTGAEVTITDIEAISTSIFTRAHHRKTKLTTGRVHQRRQGEEGVEGEGAEECNAVLPPLDRNNCDAEWCTSPDGEGGSDCWAGNGEEYSCQDGEYVLTGDTVDAYDQTWNGYTCCAAKPSVVVVETSVATTLGNVDSMWSKLNEYDVNAKLRTKCLPPAVIKYGEFVSDDDDDFDMGALVFVILAVLVVGGIAACICCYKQHALQQQRQQQVSQQVPMYVPGVEMSAQGQGFVPVAQPAGGASGLPAGWRECADPQTGKTYYQNEHSRVTQWERPV